MTTTDNEKNREAVLLVNLKARNGEQAYSLAKSELERQGIRLVKDYPVENPKKMLGLIKEVVESKPPLVIVGGGDGTISAAIDFFVGSEVVLGLLPVGTGNDLALSLGIPPGIGEACRVIADGKVGYLDLAQVNGDYFVHSAYVGPAAHLLHRLPVWSKRLFGRQAYNLMGTYALLTTESFRTVLRFDGGSCELVTPFIVFGNGRHHAAGRLFLPDWESAQTRLFAYAPRKIDRLSLLQLGRCYLTGKPADPGLVYTFVANEMEIETQPGQEISTDGEMSTFTPAKLSKADRSVKVMLPE